MLSIKINGLEKLQKKAEKIQADISHLKTANSQALAVLDRWVQDNFKGEGGKVGGWTPLKESTLRQRRNRNKGSAKILQDNGMLRQRWEHIVDDEQAILRSAVNYGIFHNKGTKKMPQRRILPTKKEAWELLKPLFEAHLKKALKG